MDKLSELQAEAKEDLIILDDEDLHQQSYKNQVIKPKWLDYKTKYKLLMFQCKADHKRLYREKWENYTGKAQPEVYQEKPFDLKILKTDVGIYLDADNELQELSQKEEYIKTMVDYVERILKEINNRQWIIKNAIEWKKFLHGE